MIQLAKNLKTVTLALFVTSMVGLMGCEGAPDAGSPEEPTATASAALINTGGGAGAGFTCDDGANTCTCTGDDDCNDMFGSGLCGGQATCDTSNPLRPICTCTQAIHAQKPKLGATKLSGTTTRALAL
jgi:hypothetical protein